MADLILYNPVLTIDVPITSDPLLFGGIYKVYTFKLNKKIEVAFFYNGRTIISPIVSNKYFKQILTISNITEVTYIKQSEFQSYNALLTQLAKSKGYSLIHLLKYVLKTPKKVKVQQETPIWLMESIFTNTQYYVMGITYNGMYKVYYRYVKENLKALQSLQFMKEHVKLTDVKYKHPLNIHSKTFNFIKEDIKELIGIDTQFIYSH